MLFVVEVVGDLRVQLLAVVVGWVGDWVCDKKIELSLAKVYVMYMQSLGSKIYWDFNEFKCKW